jgi:uncharacterized heparinase superfamily protein
VSLIEPATFNFLNEAHALAATGWDSKDLPKLWVYNQHYFDDLNAIGAQGRGNSHRALMKKWADENPPGHGTGWEPYPTSLRIVNWIKWALGGGDFPQGCIDSLATQSRWLSGRLEWHILGNHLFANAKALVFAGAYFEGAEADAWLATGLRILADELPEQILGDGGQFERSPMYHVLALEDMLDLVNLEAAFPGRISPATGRSWRQSVDRMRLWLSAMCHPDGEISFFNDAAIGIAPTPGVLDAYAQRLGFPALPPPREGATSLAESGYVRLQRGPVVALLDVAPVGPDYLPGHAHADTLSFELSLNGRRLLVNSGTSVYGAGDERLRQRGTAAHNTVTIAAEDSSEVWDGFRVARRARPFDLRIVEKQDEIVVACSHDGYRRLPGAPVHRRKWRISDRELSVVDRVTCATPCASYWRIAQDVEISGDGPFMLRRKGKPALAFAGSGGAWARTATTLHPEFGLSVPSAMLVCAFPGGESAAHMVWNDA